VHFFGKVFNKYNGVMHSSDGLSRDYSGLEGFYPVQICLTLLCCLSYRVTATNTLKQLYKIMRTAAIYTFNFYADKIDIWKRGKYFLKGKNCKYIAIADLNNIEGALTGDIYERSLLIPLFYLRTAKRRPLKC
jgi:hypothetical protein